MTHICCNLPFAKPRHMNNNFTPFPNLHTERLLLRQVTLQDDNEIFFARSDKSMNEYVGNPLAKSIEDAREWINKITNFVVTGESIFWGVCTRDNPKLIGGFCFWNLSQEEEKAEIGFGIYPQHQGKGYMNEVLAAGINFGFEKMELRSIEAYTHPLNEKSIRVLLKNNFVLKQSPAESGTPYSVYVLHRPA